MTLEIPIPVLVPIRGVARQAAQLTREALVKTLAMDLEATPGVLQAARLQVHREALIQMDLALKAPPVVTLEVVLPIALGLLLGAILVEDLLATLEIIRKADQEEFLVRIQEVDLMAALGPSTLDLKDLVAKIQECVYHPFPP